MKIVVCIKQVPKSDSVKIDPKTNNMVRDNVEGVINPFDKNAIEEALRIKDQLGGEVILLSMGPDGYMSSLRDGLAMGADRAILLSSWAFRGADTLATGYPISQAIKKIGGVDLVLLGRQSVDADTGQVGPIVAEYLNMPQVTFAEELRFVDEHILYGQRLLDGATQSVQVTLPAVVTVRSELNTPRYETPVNIQTSFEKPIDVWTEHDLDLDATRIGQAGSPTTVRKVYAPKREGRQTVQLSDDSATAVKELLARIRN
ncbi:electron transfer flavoprotein subunit beta [Leuconostoc mesenteroides subsp. sake]|uniref:electron transfer flavoprotein subunit beta/FixA family protein n=1 Tax=Leuconostoc mesenteroides TaxID=1245 RepID=UPI00107F5CD1|nr:electron transfer flavoprotein subunit beta/FixA family protein [Leuconostoc mesenteroides]QXC55179.1 electron transfer flavoprotein beta subunit/FixA family protein [Leuconostoc mesenteroides]TGD33690.1 electron transfer flavoprotein beta subunit/FixA family protein [Leuconostoc mesenteroides]USI46820.1 electron transfer flavoprotein subunit beta/FixA family protein [Leuconostoc mesenteroides]GEK66272.1 electron transfer flavoprotein subunit beta [Leuconostoc mesenteroides subsp. sake]